jgi:hypothetical protein
MSEFDNKYADTDEVPYGSGSESHEIEAERDWSHEEEAKAKRKYELLVRLFRVALTLLARLDLIIMPLLTLGFFCLRMSREPF